MNIPSIQPQIKVSELPFEQLAANKNIPEQEKVGEACRQFEAVLLRQILQEARKTVIQSKDNSGSTVSGIYDDMINNQMADTISRSGHFGLAKSLQSQLVRQVAPAVEETDKSLKLTSQPPNKSS
jgi:flagellar protein FlgJ